MMNIIKVALFVIVNIVGFFTISIVANLAIKIGVWPHLPVGVASEDFKLWFFAGGMWAYLCSMVLSIGYFFTRDEVKHWLLFAPMYCSLGYGVCVLVYFKYFYAVV